MAYNWAGRQPQPRSKESSDMLVLSRKLGEKIYIGENICITVVDIDRGKIRLGIEAPRDVPIYRQELLPLNQQQAAAQAPAQQKSVATSGPAAVRAPLPAPQTGRARAVWTDRTGVRHFRMLPGPFDSSESRTAFARLQLELETAPHSAHRADPGGITVNELLAAYKDFAEEHYRGPDGR